MMLTKAWRWRFKMDDRRNFLADGVRLGRKSKSKRKIMGEKMKTRYFLYHVFKFVLLLNRGLFSELVAGQVSNKPWGKASRYKRVWLICLTECSVWGWHLCLAKLGFRISINRKQKNKVGMLEVPLNSFR
ncbi:hypothetical protein E2542_SST13338 [Spatholobus suberectus]|nr:hypothetical protein E2542_SST13338 [Spatholobus suberectus]